MDIVLKTESQRNYFRVEPTLASILIELGFAVPYRAPAPIPAPATWAVEENQMSGRRWLVVKCDNGRFTSSFDGPPERIPDFEKTLPPDAGRCPRSVIEQYAAKYTPTTMPAEYWRALRAKEPERAR